MLAVARMGRVVERSSRRRHPIPAESRCLGLRPDGKRSRCRHPGRRQRSSPFDDAVRQMLHRPDEELIATVRRGQRADGGGRDRWERDHHGSLAPSCPGGSDGLVSGDGRWAGDRRCPHRRSGAGWTAAGRHSHRRRPSTLLRRTSDDDHLRLLVESTQTRRDGQPAAYPFGFGWDTRHSTWNSSTIGPPTVRPSPLSVSAIPGSAPAPLSPRSVLSATPRTRCLSWSVSAALSCPPRVRTQSRSTST